MDINISQQEKDDHKLSHANYRQAVQAILDDGYVVLNNAIAHESLDRLYEKMYADTQVLLQRGSIGGAGSVPGHLQQAPPPMSPWVFPDIVANPFAIQVIQGVLGRDPYLRVYSSNTNCPGSGTQPLHRDVVQELWPGLNVVHPPYSLIANLSLVDVTEDNGAIELWPGTHTYLKGSKAVEADIAEERRQTHPPIRGCTQKGAIIVRDKRIWHRGMPNHSNDVRHMISLIHNIFWIKGAGPVKFSRDCEPIFRDAGLAHNYEFTDEGLDNYLFDAYPPAPM
jgi:ectoine hydroxylase-related dioxygenase (phytanoyl-CoA dioxygenase family)